MTEKGMLPDFLIRTGIRRLNRARLAELYTGDAEQEQAAEQALVDAMRRSPIALSTKAANEQHYEVPPDFFLHVLGKHLKYSSCHWAKAKNLDEAEAEMLELTVLRAELRDGMDILELGCGWGSLTLFMAQKFPGAKITAVSNSTPQREFIQARATELGLSNVTVITADMNDFSIEQQFDRVVSVEMFEHMRNFEALFTRVHGFLKQSGKLFVHIFVNRLHTYLFEVRDETDWMAKYFFTDGTMPSSRLLLYFAQGFDIEKHWAVNGTHYGKTARAWLLNQDRNKKEIMQIFAKCYGSKDAAKWFEYWRIFFMACEELFNWDNGQEWLVNHYLFRKIGGTG